jgi:hypothetical protein
MRFFKALGKLIGQLTNQRSQVKWESPQEQEESPIENPDIMNAQQDVEQVILIRDWAMNKIDLLHEADRHRNANALAAEFDEWINLPDDSDELTYYSLDKLNGEDFALDKN